MTNARTTLIRCTGELAEALGGVEDAKRGAVTVDELQVVAMVAVAAKARIGVIAAEAEGAYVKLLGDRVEQLTSADASGTRMRTGPACRKAEAELHMEKAVVRRADASRASLRDLLWSIRNEVKRMVREQTEQRYDELPASVYATSQYHGH